MQYPRHAGQLNNIILCFPRPAYYLFHLTWLTYESRYFWSYSCEFIVLWSHLLYQSQQSSYFWKWRECNDVILILLFIHRDCVAIFSCIFNPVWWLSFPSLVRCWNKIKSPVDARDKWAHTNLTAHYNLIKAFRLPTEIQFFKLFLIKRYSIQVLVFLTTKVTIIKTFYLLTRKLIDWVQ